jgi:hypothetical protein
MFSIENEHQEYNFIITFSLTGSGINVVSKERKESYRVSMNIEDIDGSIDKYSGIPIIKLHGSPLLRYCSKCEGIEQFQLVKPIIEGVVRCAKHPEIIMRSHTIITGTPMDTSDPKMMEYIRGKCAQANAILAIGYSGRDTYLYNSILKPNRKKIWIVLPEKRSSNDPLWKLAPPQHRIDATASSFLRQWCVATREYKYTSWARSGFNRQKFQQVASYGVTIEENIPSMKQYFPNLYGSIHPIIID